MRDFEVIVVGAGSAGAMISKELARRKISVLCIEVRGPVETLKRLSYYPALFQFIVPNVSKYPEPHPDNRHAGFILIKLYISTNDN